MSQNLKAVPWDQVGTELGRKIVSSVDSLSKQVKEAQGDYSKPGAIDISNNRWRFEFCIWNMFWVWYVANSPKMSDVGATRPLLDAYHSACLKAMIEAGIIKSENQIRTWDDDVEKRFMSYKKLFENPRSGPVIDQKGWGFSPYLFPGGIPSTFVVIYINELGSSIFQGLVKMITNLETRGIFSKTEIWYLEGL